MESEQPGVLASACKTWTISADRQSLSLVVEGVADTEAILLVRVPREPKTLTLDTEAEPPRYRWDPNERLLWIHFNNTAQPRPLTLAW